MARKTVRKAIAVAAPRTESDAPPQPPDTQSNSLAPVIFVDAIQGFALDGNGIVKTTLLRDLPQFDPKLPGQKVRREVAAHLVMTLFQFRQIHQWMSDILDRVAQDAAKGQDDGAQ